MNDEAMLTDDESLGLGLDDDSAVEESVDDTIARLEAEVAQWKDHAARAAAEAENTRRRAEREGNDARAYAIQRFARDLFGVADNFERALQAAPRDHADPAVKNLVLGIEMTEKALHDAFTSNGLKRLAPARGDKFDPNKHEAVSEEPGAEDAPAGTVTRAMQSGWELFGRVVRPAMVLVAAKPAAAPNPYDAAPEPAGGGTVDTTA